MSNLVAVQTAIRARLVATAEVAALVPAEAILDRNHRPSPSPSIILGEAQEVDEDDDIKRHVTRVFHTAHVWKRETGLTGVTAIASAIRRAIAAGRLDLGAGLHCADAFVASIRTMRDPDGETAHAVVTIEVLVKEVVA